MDAACPACGVELSNAVIGRRHFFRQLVALALLCDQVQQHRLAKRLRSFQKRLHLLNIVPVDGSEIGKAEAVKKIRPQKCPAEALFELMGKLIELLPTGDFCREGAVAELEAEIVRPQTNLCQMPRNRADVRRDGHAVIV